MSKFQSGRHFAKLNNGINLAYDVQGSGPLLFVQSSGWGIGMKYMIRRLAPLAEKHTLVVLAARGCDGSSRPELETDMGSAAQSEDIEAFRQWAEVDTMDIIGHSNGAAIAIGFAARYPTRCRTLILSDAQVIGIQAPVETQAIIDARKDDPRFASAIEYEKNAKFEWDDDKLTDLLLKTYAMYFHAPEKYLEAHLKDYDFPINSWACRTHMTTDWNPAAAQLDLLPKIQARTLALVGRGDYRTPVVVSEKLTAAVKDSKLVVIEECGHMPFVEQPEQFFKEIEDFLAASQ